MDIFTDHLFHMKKKTDNKVFGDETTYDWDRAMVAYDWGLVKYQENLRQSSTQAGWWLGHPSEKYKNMKVNWDDYYQYMGK